MKRLLLLTAGLLLLSTNAALAQLGRALDARERPFPYEIAEPAPMPRADVSRVSAAPAVSEPGPVFDWRGREPLRPIRMEERVRVSSPSEMSSAAVSVQPAPNVGGAKAHFSSSRVIPLEALITYPWSAVGKVFFEAAGGKNYECSGALIAPRILLTAGHCVHSGSSGQSGFITYLEFHPGYHLGDAIGVWRATYVITTNDWVKGGGKFPNPADYALLELEDNPLGRAGDVVGWLGLLTKKLSPNHVTMLGYPGAFDRGEWMHQVSSHSFKSGGSNTVLYGTDMTQGSSGGPWVQNWGQLAAGQSGGANALVNRIVGVTSYGPKKAGEFVAGSSILDQRFTLLWNTICKRRAGNCS